MIRHFVALRYKPDTPETVKQQLMDDLAALDREIDGIIDFQTRDNTSPETPMVRGFLNLFWFDFRDETARDTYLEHPSHKAIGARLVAELQGGTDGVAVFDFTL